MISKFIFVFKICDFRFFLAEISFFVGPIKINSGIMRFESSDFKDILVCSVSNVSSHFVSWQDLINFRAIKDVVVSTFPFLSTAIFEYNKLEFKVGVLKFKVGVKRHLHPPDVSVAPGHAKPSLVWIPRAKTWQGPNHAQIFPERCGESHRNREILVVFQFIRERSELLLRHRLQQVHSARWW